MPRATSDAIASQVAASALSSASGCPRPGSLEPHAAALHDHVPFLAARDGGPDHGPRARQVEGGVVEALDQGHEGGGRRARRGCGGRRHAAVIAGDGPRCPGGGRFRR